MNLRFYFPLGQTIILLLIMAGISNGQPAIYEQTDLQSVIYSLDMSEHRAVSGGKKIIFMLRFLDFGCQPCLQNFFEVCDSIETIQNKSMNIPVYLLFLGDQSGPGYQLATMTSWARSSGLLYPVALVSAEVFDRYGIEHSSILLMDKKDTLENCGEIPFSKTTLKDFIRKIYK